MESLGRATATIAIWASLTFCMWIMNQGGTSNPFVFLAFALAAFGSTYYVWLGANNYAEEVYEEAEYADDEDVIDEEDGKDDSGI